MSDETWAAIQLAMRILLALVFVGMGVNHFVPRAATAMAAIIPPSFRRPGVPSPLVLVWFTGLCEIAGGIGLLIEPVRLAAGVALAVFLVAVFPANAFAARHPARRPHRDPAGAAPRGAGGADRPRAVRRLAALAARARGAAAGPRGRP